MNNKKDAIRLIKRFSKQYNCNPELLTAICEHESNFDQSATNTGGEIGLFQITPIVVEDYYQMTGNRVDPEDMEVNVKLGCWYVGKRIPQLLKHYKHHVNNRNIVVAYNAGIKYVSKQDNELNPITQKYIEFIKSRVKSTIIGFPPAVSIMLTVIGLFVFMSIR